MKAKHLIAAKKALFFGGLSHRPARWLGRVSITGAAIACLSLNSVAAGKGKMATLEISYSGVLACDGEVTEGDAKVSLKGVSLSDSWECPDPEEENPDYQRGLQAKRVQVTLNEPFEFSGTSHYMEPSVATIKIFGCYTLQETTPNEPDLILLTSTGHEASTTIGIGGANGVSKTFVVSTPGDGISIESRACCEEGNGKLTADGKSQATASVPATSPNWAFDGPSLGCSIQDIGNGAAIITAGEQEGTVTVVATVAASGSTCEYYGTVQLVCKPSDKEEGGGSPGSGCTDCARQFSALTAENDSGPRLHWSLGADSPETDAGSISLIIQTPGQAEAIPSNLKVPSFSTGTEFLFDEAGVLKQVKGPLGLATVTDIVDTSSQKSFKLKFYYLADVGAYDASTAVYPTSGTPFATYTIENPGGNVNKLKVTEVRGTTYTYEYTWNTGTSKWELVDLPESTRKVISWETNPGGTTSTKFHEVWSGTTLVYKEEKQYAPVDGVAQIQKLVIGSGADSIVTDYFYYGGAPASADDQYQLQRVVHSDGSWEEYQYHTGSRIKVKFSGWGNQGPTTTAALCKKVEYGYETVFADDNDVENATLPRREITSILGNEVSRLYRKLTRQAASGQQPATVRLEEQQCPNPGAAWNDLANVKTITIWEDPSGRLKQVNHPDGTMTFYTYSMSGSSLVTTISQGEPNVVADKIKNGTQRTESLGAVGEMESTVVKEIRDEVIQTTVLDQLSYTYQDALKLSHERTRLDGQKYTVAHGCCGVTSETDFEKRTTTFEYDYWKRRTNQVDAIHAIQMQTVLSAAGLPLVQKRKAGGTTIVQQQFAYDTAGRATLETNALNGVTSITYSMVANGGRKVESAMPDTGTRVEEYFKDGRIERIMGTAVNPARFVYGVEQDGGVWREYQKEIKLSSAGADTSEWSKTYTDGLGRGVKTVYAAASGTPASTREYNAKNQLVKEIDADQVVTLYEYNVKGELEYTTTDVDGNGRVALSKDRIKRVERDVTSSGFMGQAVQRERVYVWGKDADAASMLSSTTETSVDGLKSWVIQHVKTENLIRKRERSVVNTAGLYTLTETEPDNSTSVSEFTYGRLDNVTRRNNLGAQITRSSFLYDPHGRRDRVTDARNGMIVYTFNAADQVLSTTTPAPDVGQAPLVTSTHYTTMGRADVVTQTDNTTTTTEYYPTGLTKKQYGSRTYPVEYFYDAQGRMKTMTTWQNFAGPTGAAVTTWNYNPYRGWLDNKRDHANLGADYTYTSAGRLKTRQWARTGTGGQRILTTYTYGFENDGIADNQHGDLVGIAYSNDPQSTPSITYSYDRLGRKKTAIQNTGPAASTTFDYPDTTTESTLQSSETHAGGVLGGLKVTTGYDSLMRPNALSVNTASSLNRTFGYDEASRLKTVTEGTQTATYTYLANSPLVDNLVFKQGAAPRMTTTLQHDFVNRLKNIGAVPSASAPFSFGYQYNAAGQRWKVTLADNSYWQYGYDALGQVTSGKKYLSGGTSVAGQQFEYVFDDIGNRKSTKAGGDAAGQNLRAATYTPTLLNQYSSRTTDLNGGFDVLGIADANETVSVNGTSSGVVRQGQYFRKEVTVSNGSAPVWQSVSVTSTGGGSAGSGYVFVPKKPEVYDDTATPAVNEGSDADGNQLRDGRWDYTWDAENRLLRLQARTAAGPQQRIDFAYDYMGRRVAKKVWNNTAGTGTPALELRFVYDGWNLVAELNSALAVLRSYVWGLDLSRTMQGAGGVGGLLMVRDHGAGTIHAAGYDGNGNVMALVDVSTGNTTAWYEYGPFGESLRATGTIGRSNPFRFSTKYTDEESDFLYYGYRYYNPGTGQWLSSDPIGEKGGANLYGFVRNLPISQIDALGMSPADVNKIAALFKDAVVALCLQDKRCDIGSINNICSIWNDYLGCGEQALFVQERFLKASNGFDDVWTTDIPRYWLPLPHQRLEVTSKNPSDPFIILDPHRGKLTLLYPDGSETFQIITCPKKA